MFKRTHRELEAPIQIQNKIIPYSNSLKYIGLTLGSKLTFSKHIQNSINKSYCALYISYPLFKSCTLSKRIKVVLYSAIIRSMLLYGCEAWSILAKCHKKQVQIMQNKCLKIIFNAPRYTRISDLHKLANLPYNDELLDHHVHRMYNVISSHEIL